MKYNEFSLLKFLDETESRSLTGNESEVVTSLMKGSTLMPRLSGNLIPLSAIIPEQRATMTTANTPAVGSIRPTFSASLQPNSFLKRAGVKIYEGLTFDLAVPTGTEFVLNYEGETDQNEIITPTIGKADYAPWRVSGTVNVSNSLMRLASPVVEQYLRTEFTNALTAALEDALLNGNGTDKPRGVINTTGINAVTTTALSYADLIAIEKAIAANNGLSEFSTVVFNPNDAAKLRNMSIESGSGEILYNKNGNVLNYPAINTSSCTSGKVILGDFTRSGVAIYGVNNIAVIDITIDRITGYRQGITIVTLNAYVSAAVEQPKSFGVITIS